MFRLIVIITLFLLTGLIGATADLSEHAKKVIFKDDTLAAATAKIIWQDSNYASCKLIQYNNSSSISIFQHQSYIIIDDPFFNKQGSSTLVISQNSEWIFGLGESNEPWLEAKATLIDSTGSASRIWSITEEANDGEQDYQFYRTELYGCCAGFTINRLHRLTDGKEIFAFTDDLVSYTATPYDQSIQIGDRYIGALPYGYLEDGYPFCKDSLVFASITYASRDSCLHSFYFQAKSRPVFESFDSCGLGHCFVSVIDADSAFPTAKLYPELWLISVNRPEVVAPMMERCLQVKFDCETPVFIIPLWDDDFVLERTDFADFRIVRVR